MIQENSEEKDIDIDALISTLQSTLEYNKQSVSRIRKLLDKVIDPEELSDNSKKMLAEAAKALQVLNADAVFGNELLYADKKMHLSKIATEKAFLQLEINPLIEKDEKINMRAAELQQEIHLAKKYYKELQEGQEKKMADKEFLKLKVEGQKKKLEELKVEIQHLGIPNLEDNKELQEKIECTRQMKNECTALQTEIDRYRALPPNLDKAKEVLMQTKLEHEQVCKRLNSQLIQRSKWKPGRVP